MASLYGTYRTYPDWVTGAPDFIADNVENNSADWTGVMTNVSFRINEAYLQSKAANPSIDITTFNWKANPSVQTAIQWLELYFQQWFGIQVMDTTSPNYGSFSNSGTFGGGANLNAIWWTFNTYCAVLSHYVHLYDGTFLRQARGSVMAGLSAQYTVVSQYNGFSG